MQAQIPVGLYRQWDRWPYQRTGHDESRIPDTHCPRWCGAKCDNRRIATAMQGVNLQSAPGGVASGPRATSDITDPGMGSVKFVSTTAAASMGIAANGSRTPKA